MNLSAYLAVISGIIAYIAFCGSVFLSEYYGSFGVQLQFLDITTDHYLIRGLDVLRYDLVLLFAFVLLFALALFSLAPFSLQVLNIRVPKTGPFLIALPIIVLLVDARISSTAQAAAVRDMFTDSTALRRLECLRTGDTEADNWIASLVTDGQKILVLFRSQEQIIVFREPPFAAEQLTVDTYFIVVPTSHEMRTSSAHSEPHSSRDHLQCFSR